MIMYTGLSKRQFIGLTLFIGAFVGAAYLAGLYENELANLVESYGLLSAVLYFGIALTATVVAPLNMTFLIPVASVAFGPLVAALLSIAGWTLGSIIAFHIAKRYGKPIVARFINIEKLNAISTIIPKKNIFIWIVIIRMVVPADILSYAIGILLQISYVQYSLATLIGVTPFAFIFAYASTLPLLYMVSTITLALLSSAIGGWWVIKTLKRQNKITPNNDPDLNQQ